MKLDDSQKASILLAALSERYAAQHRIRERVDGICIWALGLLLGAGGWVLYSGPELPPTHKLVAILGLAGAFSALRFGYLADLKRGFSGQQRAAVKLEKALGFFTPGALDGSENSIYEASWAKAGTGEGSGKFFDSTYALLYVGFLFLGLALLFGGGVDSDQPSECARPPHSWPHRHR